MNLHNHSTHSDGTLRVPELAAAAVRAGIKYFSLTDHDTTAGSAAMAAALKGCGVKYCHGVEITTYPHDYLHVLGYGLDPAHPALLASLDGFRQLKLARVAKVLELLAGQGVHIKFEDLRWRGGSPPDTWQVADAMCAAGAVPDRAQAFSRYLGIGKAAYVRREGPSVPDAIKTIRAAGGRPVLAHPYSVGKDMDLPAWKDAGLEGIEAFYPAHSESFTREILAEARRYGLFVTAGTDFHGPGTERDKMTGFRLPVECLGTLDILFGG